MEYYNKVGLKALPQVFVNGFPLGENEIEADAFEESVITKVMTLTQDIQMAVYRGQLHESMNLLDWLMNKDNIMPRLNPRVLSTQERQYIDLGIYIRLCFFKQFVSIGVLET
jgi:UDP-glucose:glycoprotein glucosyltransferase